MSNLEQLLHERLKQLEAGESLGSCLTGLPEEEAKALQLIAGIRMLAIDDIDEESVRAQRRNVLQAAAVRLNGTNAPAGAGNLFLAQLQTVFQRFFAHRELAIGLASLLVIVVLGLAWRGMAQRQNAESGGAVSSIRDDDDDEREPDVETDTPVTTAIDEAESPVETDADVPTIVDGETLFIPVVTSPLNVNPQTAVIDDIQGIVEIQTNTDVWTPVDNPTTIAAGQRVRTGKLSQATLSFYDGSQAHLGADTEISIDELNALRPEEGFRTVVITQWIGDSEHSVHFRNDGGSLYEVKTPEGSGIARGTKFHVVVTPDLLTQYIVTEGKVDVSGQSRTVSVTAGQLTTLITGAAPRDPTFNISGEGEVTTVGAVWTIAGQTFQTHEHTILVGNPQVGDLVQVSGHLLPDGSRVADRIILLRRAVSNRFSLSGDVEAMGTTWTIAGQAVLVNDQTRVDEAIAVGDSVRVEGIILPGGTLQAQVITRLQDAPGLPFQFSGIVEAINQDSWIISGQSITVNGETAVDNTIIVGDLVTVNGWQLEDNSWLADKINRLSTELPTFEFTGVVQSMASWQVAGISFETRAWTVIAPAINLGDWVRVSGTILADGTWVANTISSMANVQPNVITFVGIVASLDPLVVNGLLLADTPNTIILGDIAVGVQVVVQAQLLPDGTWAVLSVRLLNPNFGHGCLTLSSPIITVNANAIQVKHWHVDIKRDGRIKIHGNLKVNSVITIPICAGYDGSTIIIGDIIVIYQPVVIIINDGSGGSIPPECRLTSKGSIKCSGKSSRKSSR